MKIKSGIRPVYPLVLCVLLAFPALASALTPEALHRGFIASMARSHPRTFSCRISGSAIDASIARIPADARKGGALVVNTYYRQGTGQVIRVSGVDDAFRNMFAAYQSYLSMTGAWIENRGRNWADFSQRHRLQIVGETPAAWRVRIDYQGQSDESYGLFEFSKTDYFVSGVRFFNRGALVYSVANAYQRIGQYVLPLRMLITSYRDNRPATTSQLDFSDYRLNITIPDAIFQR